MKSVNQILPARWVFGIVKRRVQGILNGLRLDLKRAGNRVLPTNELAWDLNEKARFLGFGEGSRVYDSCCVFGEVRAGKNVWVGPFTLLDGAGGLVIGDNCSIGAGAQIYTHDSMRSSLSGGREPYDYSATTIGSDCYIGPNVIIARGVTLGDRCVVGANSFVNRSFDSDSKIAGNPARAID